MEEVKILRSQPLLIIGLFGGIVAIILGLYFYSLADGPSITSPLIVMLIAGFIGLSGLLAIVIFIRETINPSTLVINEKGLNSRISFGFVPWDEVVSIEVYDRLERIGNRALMVKGLLIEVKDPGKIMDKIKGLKRYGTSRSFRLRGSPVFVPEATWSWRQDKIHEILQTYLAEHRKSTGSGEKTDTPHR